MKHQTYNIELALACPRMRMQKSNKRNLVLYIDNELVEKSRNLGFNLSKTFENHLEDLINRLSTVNPMNNFNSTDKNSSWWAGPDLNRRPLARKANVLTKLDDRPNHCKFIFETIFSNMSIGFSSFSSRFFTFHLRPKFFSAHSNACGMSVKVKIGKPFLAK